MSLDSGKPVSRVEAVIFDAMHTVIEPRIPRFFHVLAIFEEVLGIRIQPKKLARLLKEVQKQVGPSADFKRDWIGWNNLIIAGLLEKPAEEVEPALGEQIHQKTIKEVNRYEIKPGIRNLLRLLSNLRVFPRERLREAIPVVSRDNASIQVKIEVYEPPKLILASNQYRAYLETMVEDLQLEEFFGPRVISSDQLGCTKPDLRFYEKVLDWCSLESDQAVVVGNSVTRDLPPAKYLEIPLCLYDRRGKLDLPPEPNVVVVRTIAEMQDWLLSRLIPGWVQKEEKPIEPFLS